MFSDNAKTFIETAIHAETEEAVAKWGKTYNSIHEGYAVLKEEVDEARDEKIKVQNYMYTLWGQIKTGDDAASIRKCVEEIRKHAELLAMEAVQVCAVCNKILNSV